MTFLRKKKIQVGNKISFPLFLPNEKKLRTKINPFTGKLYVSVLWNYLCKRISAWLTFLALLFDSFALPLRENVFPGKVRCISNRRVSATALQTWMHSRQTPILASTRLCQPICLGASQLFAESRSSPPPPAAPAISAHSPGLPLLVFEALPRSQRELSPAPLRQESYSGSSRGGPTRALRAARCRTGSESSVAAAGAGRPARPAGSRHQTSRLRPAGPAVEEFLKSVCKT